MLLIVAVFDKRALAAKFRNQQITAKGIRNGVTLFHSARLKNKQSKGFNSIVKILGDMDKDWVEEQKQFQTTEDSREH